MPKSNVIKFNPETVSPEEIKDMFPWEEMKCVVIIGIDHEEKTVVGCSETTENEMSVMAMDLMDYKMNSKGKGFNS